MDGFVSGLHLNVDLTLLDRMQLLLSRQPGAQQDAGKTWSLHGGPSVDRVKHSLYMTSSNINTIQLVHTQQDWGGGGGGNYMGRGYRTVLHWGSIIFCSKDKRCSIKL